MWKNLDNLFSNPIFRKRLLKRLEEGWTFEKIEPMSTEEIFARLNRLGVAVTPEEFRQAAQRHESAERLWRMSGASGIRSTLRAATMRTLSGWRPSSFGSGWSRIVSLWSR